MTVQRTLLGTTWSSPHPLRVRMAVHAGAAERRAGNWFGPTLNRTARLLATSAGGQVVCSHVAAELAQHDLPDGVGFVDLGEHRLADLTRPERVYQVTHPDLPGDFPPLQSLDARRHNLPVALTSFVGREGELSEVVSLLTTSRLLTLAGTGGAGKTRLALQAAAGAVERFPDGAWFVELAPLRDPGLVGNEVVTSLGLLPSAFVHPGESLEERLCEHLRTRRLLLVLDNCEHVVETAARLAHTVLARCPDVTVLATSREVLGVPGEVVWNVPPLSMPPDEAAGVEELASSDAVLRPAVLRTGPGGPGGLRAERRQRRRGGERRQRSSKRRGDSPTGSRTTPCAPTCCARSPWWLLCGAITRPPPRSPPRASAAPNGSRERLVC